MRHLLPYPLPLTPTPHHLMYSRSGSSAHVPASSATRGEGPREVCLAQPPHPQAQTHPHVWWRACTPTPYSVTHPDPPSSPIPSLARVPTTHRALAIVRPPPRPMSPLPRGAPTAPPDPHPAFTLRKFGSEVPTCPSQLAAAHPSHLPLSPVSQSAPPCGMKPPLHLAWSLPLTCTLAAAATDREPHQIPRLRVHFTALQQQNMPTFSPFTAVAAPFPPSPPPLLPPLG